MKTLVRQYKQFRAMEREIWELRQENAELKKWLQRYEEASAEDREAARESVRATIELVKMIGEK
jgi:septal ring factor EnvC (AmiA/AmiB activator)